MLIKKVMQGIDMKKLTKKRIIQFIIGFLAGALVYYLLENLKFLGFGNTI